MPKILPMAGQEEAKVDHDAIHTEVARYLTNPVALHEALNQSSVYSVCDADVLHKLMLFQGFITKIKHNGLRKIIPCTLRLMTALKVEVDFFAAVSTKYVDLRKSGPIPTEKHLEWFINEVLFWVEETQQEGRVLISNVLHHETTIFDIVYEQPQKKFDALPQVPQFIGDVRLARFEMDVLAAVNALSQGKFSLETDWIKRNVNLLYHRSPNRSLSMMEIDPFLGLILSFVDGESTVHDMVNILNNQGLPEATFEVLHSAFKQAADKGLLAYES